MSTPLPLEQAHIDSLRTQTINRQGHLIDGLRVAAIVPWNFSLMIGAWKLAPALAVFDPWCAEGIVKSSASGLST